MRFRCCRPIACPLRINGCNFDTWAVLRPSSRRLVPSRPHHDPERPAPAARQAASQPQCHLVLRPPIRRSPDRFKRPRTRAPWLETRGTSLSGTEGSLKHILPNPTEPPLRSTPSEPSFLLDHIACAKLAHGHHHGPAESNAWPVQRPAIVSPGPPREPCSWTTTCTEFRCDIQRPSAASPSRAEPSQCFFQRDAVGLELDDAIAGHISRPRGDAERSRK